MTNLEIIIESFQGLLAQACLFALLVIVCVCTVMKFFGLSCSSLSKLRQKSRMGLASLALLSVVMGLWADKTNLLRQVIHPWNFGDPQVVVVSETDILRGFRMEGVATNEMPFCEMPTNAVEYAPFHLSGGRERCFPLNLGDFVFPYGTNNINRFCVLSGGTIETYPRLNAPASICAAREYASLIPGVSRFWCADENDGAEKVLRWDSVFASRDHTGEYTAEIRLCANGDFSTRSNALETVYRRVNPNDWDGDGLANEIDANPTTTDGDFFGTGVNWLNVNCAGVLSAATNGMGEVEISWHANANPNAYYWLDLAATGTLGVAKITATCNGESYLGDLAVIARTNEVCHIPLLIGATYTVESDLPITYSAVSSEHANILTNSEHSLVVSFPLEFSFEPIRAAASFRLVSLPVDVNAMLVSVLGGCCSCQTNDVGFTWSCGGNCSCGGGVSQMLFSTATWQGYSSLFTRWHVCPCTNGATTGGGQGDPSPRLVIDSPNVLFANDDTHGAQPSDVVRVLAGISCPTSGTLTLNSACGTFKVWAMSNRTCEVSLPYQWNIDNGAARAFYLEGVCPIMYGWECLNLTWKDPAGATLLSTNVELAVYSPNLNVVNNILYDDGDLCNPAAIVTGTNACFALEFHNVHPQPGEICWSIVEGDAWFVGTNIGERVRVASDTPGQRVKLRAQIGDCRSRPPEVSAYVVNPLSVKATVWIVGNRFGTRYAADESRVRGMVAGANKIFEQVGISFYIDSITYTNRDDLLSIKKDVISNVPGEINYRQERLYELVGFSHNTQGVELYFIDEIDPDTIGINTPFGAVLSASADANVLAHELGHACGAKDIYPCSRYDANVFLLDNSVKENNLPDDWNNGEGFRYYEALLRQEDLVKRLLMCGFNYSDNLDMTSGTVRGFVNALEAVSDVGFFPNGERRTPVHQ